MGKQSSSRKKYYIIKTVMICGFFASLASACIFAETRTAEAARAEQASVKAARRPMELEVDEVRDVQTVLLPMVNTGTEQPSVETTKEIVDDSILSNVPAADYAYSFDKQMDGAKVVTRQGDYGGFNEGAYPEENLEKAPLFTEGIEGDAIYLDGSYGVELCGVALTSESYTISFWMKAEEIYDWSPFLAIGSHILNYEENKNYICFNKKTSEDGEEVLPVFNTINDTLENSCEVRPSLEDKRCINLNEWCYITVRVDASQVSETDPNKVTAYLYLNSELIGCSEVSRMSFDMENMKAYLGINCHDRLFRACYDEVRIWNCLLDENQISDMYVAYISAEQQEQ